MPKNKPADEFFVSADGGSRGNPGPSAIGVVITDKNNKPIKEISKFIGEGTNNMAEYLAVIYGLQECVLLGVRNVTLKLDSQLVARQLTGSYRVKDKNMRIFHDIVKNMMRYFERVEIKEVPRSFNAEADRLVNQAFENKILL